MSDITYCADAEFCELRHKCKRARCPKTITLYSKFYENRVLEWKKKKCEYYYPNNPEKVITNSYQENKKKHCLFK